MNIEDFANNLIAQAEKAIAPENEEITVKVLDSLTKKEDRSVEELVISILITDLLRKQELSFLFSKQTPIINHQVLDLQLSLVLTREQHIELKNQIIEEKI